MAGIDLNWGAVSTSQAFIALAAIFFIVWSYTPTFMGIGAPYAGYSSFIVPGAWVRFRFTKGARDIINNGYKHVSLFVHTFFGVAVLMFFETVEECHVQTLTY